MPHNICLSIAIDRDNVKWIGTLEGLCRYDGNQWTIYNTDNCPLPGNQINSLAIDAEGLLWMATDGGVAVFDRVNRWDAFVGGQGDLPKCMYQKVAIDKKGNRWFGTDEKGLLCLSGYKMRDEKAEAETEEISPEVATTDSDEKTKRKDSETSETSSDPDDRVRLTPFLEDGYITINMGAAEAEVSFYNARGEKVRTVPKYRNGSHLTIAKMKKGSYTVKVKTSKSTRTVKFVLK